MHIALIFVICAQVQLTLVMHMLRHRVPLCHISSSESLSLCTQARTAVRLDRDWAGKQAVF